MGRRHHGSIKTSGGHRRFMTRPGRQKRLLLKWLWPSTRTPSDRDGPVRVPSTRNCSETLGRPGQAKSSLGKRPSESGRSSVTTRKVNESLSVDGAIVNEAHATGPVATWSWATEATEKLLTRFLSQLATGSSKVRTVRSRLSGCNDASSGMAFLGWFAERTWR